MHKNLQLLRIHAFLTSCIFFAPVAILYFQSITGSYASGMMVFSFVFLTSAILEVPTGILSDLWGRKGVLVASTISIIIALVCYAWGGSLFVLLLAAFFDGLARSLASGNNESLLHDSYKEGEKQEFYKGVAVIESASAWGFAVSALVGAALASYSFQLALWASVFPALFSLWFALKLQEPPKLHHIESHAYKHFRKAVMLFFTNPRLRLLSIHSILGRSLGENSYQFQAAFYTLFWPIWAVGVAKIFSNVFSALSFSFVHALRVNFSAPVIMLIGNVYSRALSFIALLFPSIYSPALLILISLAHGTTKTSRQEMLHKEFSESQRATMASLDSLLSGISYAILGPILGLIADIYGPIQGLLVFQALMLLQILPLLALMNSNETKRIGNS